MKKTIAPAREKIRKFVLSQKKPVSTVEIIEKFDGEINKVTVYRVLETLNLNGEVRKIDLSDGLLRFESAKDDHHHLVCENCGKISDVLSCPLDGIVEEIEEKQGFKVKRHSLEFFGVCRECLAKD